MSDYGTPRLYVGTYHKYNCGSIKGAWIDLDDGDEDDFWAAAKELHKDEADPELMFQDFEGFPRALYGESSLDPRIWEWIDLDEHQKEAVALYWDHVNGDGSVEDALNAYAGSYDSERDWAEQFLEEIGGLSEIPEHLRYYFDYEAYAKDSDMYFVHDGGSVHAFDRNA